MRLVGRIWIVLMCALLLAACGSDDAPGDPVGDSTPPAAGSASPTPATSEMEVGEVIWAHATDSDTGEPTEVVTRFTIQSPAIIAAIEVGDIPEGTEFTASWAINDLPIDGTEMDITASEDLDHAWIAFSFTRDTGQRYPLGQLSVVITTSEGDEREGSVEIGFP